MTSDRLQRQVERLLNEADEALTARNWATVRERAEDALAIAPDNSEAAGFLAAATRALGADDAGSGSATKPAPSASPSTTPQPTSFASGRYEVKRFLGEGGKKRVYLAHDAQLDRDVAFALIKTEGLDDAARVRAMRNDGYRTTTRSASAHALLGELLLELGDLGGVNDRLLKPFRQAMHDVGVRLRFALAG